MSAKEHSGLFRETLLSRWTSGRRQPAASPVSASTDGKPVPALPGLVLIRKLGEGGMASVYLARQESTGREVAVKIMASHLQADSRWTARFLDEARRMAELSHPNIVPVFDWGTCNGVGFIIMEYLRGGDLGFRLKHRRMTLAEVIEIVRQVAAGLDFAGEKGYVHRDVKPENILFREDGSPCILDFGIAKEGSSNTTISSQGIAIGTGAYMSPEQAQPAGRQIDHRSDLYSLGVILYQMLAGHRPFEFSHTDPVQTFQLYLFAHLHTVPPSLPAMFGDFQLIIDRLLAKDPAGRFKRGSELRQALSQLEACLPATLLEYPVRDPQPATDGETGAVAPDRQETTRSTPGADHYTAPHVAIADPLVATVVVNREPLSPAGLPAGRWRWVLVACVLVVAVLALRLTQESRQPDVALPSPVLLSATSSAAPITVPVIVQAAQPEIDPRHAEVQRLLGETQQFMSLTASTLKQRAELVALYQDILRLDPQQADATAGMSVLLEQEMALVNGRLRRGVLNEVPDHIVLIARIAPASAQAAQQAYSEALAENRRREAMAQLEKREARLKNDVERVGQKDAISLAELLQAVSDLQSLQQQGLPAVRADRYADTLSSRYRDRLAAYLDAGDDAEASRWLEQAHRMAIDQALVQRYQIKIVELQRARLESASSPSVAAAPVEPVQVKQEKEDMLPVPVKEEQRGVSGVEPRQEPSEAENFSTF